MLFFVSTKLSYIQDVFMKLPIHNAALGIWAFSVLFDQPVSFHWVKWGNVANDTSLVCHQIGKGAVAGAFFQRIVS